MSSFKKSRRIAFETCKLWPNHEQVWQTWGWGGGGGEKPDPVKGGRREWLLPKFITGKQGFRADCVSLAEQWRLLIGRAVEASHWPSSRGFTLARLLLGEEKSFLLRGGGRGAK